MKYIVTRTSDTTWTVDGEDTDLHYVHYDIFKQKFVCDCIIDEIIEEGSTCKHKLFVKENLAYGTTEFDDKY